MGNGSRESAPSAGVSRGECGRALDSRTIVGGCCRRAMRQIGSLAWIESAGPGSAGRPHLLPSQSRMTVRTPVTLGVTGVRDPRQCVDAKEVLLSFAVAHYKEWWRWSSLNIQLHCIMVDGEQFDGAAPFGGCFARRVRAWNRWPLPFIPAAQQDDYPDFRTSGRDRSERSLLAHRCANGLFSVA